MSTQAERIDNRLFDELPQGSLIVTFLEDGRVFRSTLLDGPEGVATVFPVEPGQEPILKPGNLEAVSKMGSLAVQGKIKPRILPIEAAEGLVVWGFLSPGQELVFQNECDAKGTFTYTGSTILRAYVQRPE